MAKHAQNLENLRVELGQLIEKAGSDYKACKILKPYCRGFCPDRSTLGRFRRGEGKPALIAMTVVLLKLALDSEVLVDYGKGGVERRRVNAQ